jgi:hypothetical protein
LTPVPETSFKSDVDCGTPLEVFDHPSSRWKLLTGTVLGRASGDGSRRFINEALAAIESAVEEVDPPDLASKEHA